MDNQKRVWSWMGIFVIALVISIPFYVADTYAISLSITTNYGDDKINGFIDADGDSWVVEAMITGASNSTIDPKDVKINVKGNQDDFNSCSDSALGTICKYISPLKDGILSGVYDFSVLYYFADSLGVNSSVSSSDKIKADGTTLADAYTTALTIDLKSVKQYSTGIQMDFRVEDKQTAYCSGLKTIEIIDSLSGTLKTISNFSAGDCLYDFKSDSSSSGLLDVNLTGEGTRWIKIKATDNLGHTLTSGAVSFMSDFVKPVIDKNSLVLKDFGTFIGQYEATTDIAVNLTDNGTLSKVTATSSEAKIEGGAATCTEDSKVDGLWTCVWEDVKVIPKSTISLVVTAEDSLGNKVTETISKALTVDSSAPKSTFFGTSRTYQKVSYVSGKSGVANHIVLQASETGAGLSQEGVLASLSGLGGSTAQKADYYNNTTNEFHWEVDYSGGTDQVLIGLYKFEDKVGNKGTIPQMKVQVDDQGPTIEKLEIYGTSTTATKKTYFQSSDKLNLEFKIKEINGLLILVDLNDIVNDAQTNYPDSKVKAVYPEAGTTDYSGWMVFTEDDCDGTSANWTCSLETPTIKSGPDSSAELNIEVYDTAGNPAISWPTTGPRNIKSGSKGEYNIDILGLSNEETPDYWAISSVYSLGGEDDFIDIDTTQQIPSRIAMKVVLKTDSRAEAGKIDLVSCTPESGFSAKSREILFDNLGGVASATPQPIMILEFSPFDSKTYFDVTSTEGTFDKAYLTYTCKLNIFSKVGKTALKNAEVQEVIIKIPFGFTNLGSLDENLDALIDNAKEGYYEDTEWIGTLGEILDWIGYIANILSTIASLAQILNLFESSTSTEGAVLTDTGFLSTAGKLLQGTCMAMNQGESSVWKYVEYLQIPAQIMNCQPGGASMTKEGDMIRGSGAQKTVFNEKQDKFVPYDGETGKALGGEVSGVESAFGSANWYFQYQRSVLQVYNVFTGRTFLGIPANNLYDNFYLSFIGLCIPGIVFNLKRLREVHCRKIVCLQKEVPQGIATVESCNQLYELQHCEFFVGPLFQMLPGFNLMDTLSQIVKNIFSSPVGLIVTAVELLACGSLCFVDNAGGAALIPCKVVKFLSKLLNIVNSVIGFVNSRPDVTKSPYCGMVEDLDEAKEKKAGATTATTTAPVTSTTTTAPTTSTTTTPTTTPTTTAPTTSTTTNTNS